MQGNFIMLQKEDLKEVVAELVTELLANNKQVKPTSYGDGEYYTRAQVCERLHITQTTLWRMEKSKKLVAYKIGRRSLYSKGDVEDIIKAGAPSGEKSTKYESQRN